MRHEKMRDVTRWKAEKEAISSSAHLQSSTWMLSVLSKMPISHSMQLSMTKFWMIDGGRKGEQKIDVLSFDV